MRSLLLLLAASIAGHSMAVESRIVFGTPITEVNAKNPQLEYRRNWDYHASLQISFEGTSGGTEYAHICGAAYVGNNLFLTAAHCIERVEGQPNFDLHILVGDYKLNAQGKGEGLRMQAVQSRMHPLYDPASFAHDLAIVQVTSAATIDPLQIEPVTLPAQNAAEPDWFRLAGWGDTDEVNGSELYPVELQTAVLSNRSTCKSLYGYAFDPAIHICALGGQATSVYSTDSCQGDSGGSILALDNPTLSDEKLGLESHGVVSFGQACGIGAAVYAKTDDPWLRAVIAEPELLNWQNPALPEYNAIADLSKNQVSGLEATVTRPFVAQQTGTNSTLGYSAGAITLRNVSSESMQISSFTASVFTIFNSAGEVVGCEQVGSLAPGQSCEIELDVIARETAQKDLLRFSVDGRDVVFPLYARGTERTPMLQTNEYAVFSDMNWAYSVANDQFTSPALSDGEQANLTIVALEDGLLNANYVVSSELNGDGLFVVSDEYRNGEFISGTCEGGAFIPVNAGESVTFIYGKDQDISAGSDRAQISNFSLVTMSTLPSFASFAANCDQAQRPAFVGNSSGGGSSAGSAGWPAFVLLLTILGLWRRKQH